MSYNWKALIGKVAPTLATALGGPLAGAATQALSSALTGKVDSSEAEISAALATGNLDALEKVKDAEFTFLAKMKALDVDILKIGNENTEDARGRDEEFIKQGMNNRRADALAYLSIIVLVFEILAALYVMLFTNMTDMKMQAAFALLNMAIGNQLKTVNDVYNFEFGSSQGSVQAQKSLRRIAES